MDNSKYAWKYFARIGDEFIIAYSKLTGQTPAATVFNIGHAIELYLKAVILKLDPETNVFNYGHDVGELLTAINSMEPGLLVRFQLNPEFYAKFIDKKIGDNIDYDDPDYPEFLTHQELYWVAKYLMHIKYLGTPKTKLPESYVFYSTPCSHYWIAFLKEVRQFLNWPKEGGDYDSIRDSVQYNTSEQSRIYLKQLL
jgi:HEPN domain-containing protein